MIREKTMEIRSLIQVSATTTKKDDKGYDEAFDHGLSLYLSAASKQCGTRIRSLNCETEYRGSPVWKGDCNRNMRSIDRTAL